VRTKYFTVVIGVKHSIWPTWKQAQLEGLSFLKTHSRVDPHSVWVQSSTGLVWELGEEEHGR